MRYVTVRVTPTEGRSFHPLGADLAAEPSIRRDAIHHVELLSDGTGAMLASARGDRGRYEEIMDASPYVLEFAVSGDDDRWLAYSHYEPTDLVREMMETRQAMELVIDMPIRVDEDGTFTVTYIGEEESFQALLAGGPSAEAFDVELVETGDYDPETGTLLSGLTTRQQEVLEAAVELGYYDVPRTATQEEVAATVDAAATTVGEHLRKIESRVFGALVG